MSFAMKIVCIFSINEMYLFIDTIKSCSCLVYDYGVK